jgi:transposase
VGALGELAPKARPAKRTPEQVELDRAQRWIGRLESDLVKHQLALEIQGKASELLGWLLAERNQDRRRQP